LCSGDALTQRAGCFDGTGWQLVGRTGVESVAWRARPVRCDTLRRFVRQLGLKLRRATVTVRRRLELGERPMDVAKANVVSV
jgi:hypothetical protein